MDELSLYKLAYERERKARIEAESLLRDKSRELYDNITRAEEALKELQHTQSQLLQSEKMASIGQLAAGIAHEINNPLGFIISNISILKEYQQAISLFIKQANLLCQAPNTSNIKHLTELFIQHDLLYIQDDTPTLIDESLNGLHRVRDIVHSVKKFTHSSDGDFVECDINDCLETALKVVANELKHKVTVSTHLASLPLIFALPAELQQVFMNLLINAAQACDTNGELTITSRVQKNTNASMIEIHIQDNGIGMDKETQRQIFDPFFTTKAIGIGTGLGLSISFGIIAKHGGTISVDSALGKGSNFMITLPIAKFPAIQSS